MWCKIEAVSRSAVMLLLCMITFCVTENGMAMDWTEREFVKFRLLPDRTTANGDSEILIGLEVNLEAGWHFYSENPGEFGVAPKFDWRASRNLAQAKIYWPEPTRIDYIIDPPVSVMGYYEELLLPIILETASANDDFDVRLILEYAVCNDYCIIDTVSLGLFLPGGAGETTLYNERLRHALAKAKAASP